MIRVLVADDHPVVREGLRKMISLTDDIEVVGEAVNGEDAVAKVEALSPHVVLMDLRMPGDRRGGGDPKRIRAGTPSAEVIVLSNYDEDRYIFDALRAGAKSYLLKDASPERLADAIRSVARGESTLDSGVMSRVVSEFRHMGTGVGQRGERLTAARAGDPAMLGGRPQQSGGSRRARREREDREEPPHEHLSQAGSPRSWPGDRGRAPRWASDSPRQPARLRAPGTDLRRSS